MTSRTINAPGIELNEIDKSSYNDKQDYSIVGTTTFVCGFADKGENYKINWINSKNTLLDTYGAPSNEHESIMYNACAEVLNNGGILLAARLPYDNDALSTYSYCKYDIVGDDSNDPFEIDYESELSQISNVDNTISSYFVIQNAADSSNGRMTIDSFDDNKVKGNTETNTIKIVDISRRKYGTTTIFNDDNITTSAECLGIMPVLVAPTNAMYFQGILSNETTVLSTDMKEHTSEISTYQAISKMSTKSNQLSSIRIDNFGTLLSSTSINDYTMSKQVGNLFPYIGTTYSGNLDRTYLKQIGLVVFEVYKDAASDNKINFKLLESFVGSLDKKAKDELTNSNIFIDNIVNAKSNYVNIFTNCDTKSSLYAGASIVHISNQVGKSLGYTSSEAAKHITYTTSFVNSLNIIFDMLQDYNTYPLDIVLDAGTSNFAAMTVNENYKSLADLPLLSNNDSRGCLGRQSVILQKFDGFCKNMRKDCMFIADSYRGVCLEGNDKIIRITKPENTVEKSIVPYIRYMNALNSSYSAGYCNWFKAYDEYTQDAYWCPPSIKVIGNYLYTDTFYNYWSAPAGMNRGIVRNVIDCAFSPTTESAGKIYQQQWNYAINYPIYGIVIEGQKTFQTKQTAFDRVNVRRLFLYLEKQVKNIARFFTYEGNTSYTRQKFVDTIRPIFEEAKDKAGIIEYYIRCDDTNNTTQTIENNELHCTIAVKPVKTIEFIVLNFVCTNQTANVVEMTK